MCTPHVRPNAGKLGEPRGSILGFALSKRRISWSCLKTSAAKPSTARLAALLGGGRLQQRLPGPLLLAQLSQGRDARCCRSLSAVQLRAQRRAGVVLPKAQQPAEMMVIVRSEQGSWSGPPPRNLLLLPLLRFWLWFMNGVGKSPNAAQWMRGVAIVRGRKTKAWKTAFKLIISRRHIRVCISRED